MAFNQTKFKYNFYYTFNNLKLKFGEKALNQEYLGNYKANIALYEVR